MAIQTRSLFYISLKNIDGETLFFTYDSNFKNHPVCVSEDFEDAKIGEESYMKGRVSRIKKCGLPDGEKFIPESITIHEIKFSHGVE